MPSELGFPTVDELQAAEENYKSPLGFPSLSELNRLAAQKVPAANLKPLEGYAGENQGWLASGLRQGAMGVVGGVANIPRLVTGDPNAMGSDLASGAAEGVAAIERQREDGGEGWLARQARNATSSLANMGIGQALGALSRIPGGPLAGGVVAAAASQANQSYHEAIKAGKTHEEANAHARTQGAIEGGVTTLFNLVGMGGAEKTLAGAFKKDFASSIAKATAKGLGKDFAKTQGKELAEELTTNFLEAVDSKLRDVNPHALDRNSLVQMAIDTAAQTFLVSGAAFAPHATVKALESLQNERTRKADEQNINAGTIAGQPVSPQPATPGNQPQPVATPDWAQSAPQPAATQPQPQQQEPPGTLAPAPQAPQEAPNAAPPVEAPPQSTAAQGEVPTPLQVPAEPVHNPPPAIIPEHVPPENFGVKFDEPAVPETSTHTPQAIASDMAQAEKLGIIPEIVRLTQQHGQESYSKITDDLMKRLYPDLTAFRNRKRWEAVRAPLSRVVMAVQLAVEIPGHNKELTLSRDYVRTGPATQIPEMPKQAAPALPGAQAQMFGGAEAQGKLFNAAPAGKPKVQPVATKTESPADITIAQPTIEGQQPLFVEEKPALQAKREATRKKRQDQNLFDRAEHNILKIAAERKIATEKMHAAVDRAIETEREHWDLLKGVVGTSNRLTPSQRKKLREGDEASVKGVSDFDELRERAEAANIPFETVKDVLKHGMPPEPVATNKAFVERVADELAREQPAAERGDASEENLPPDVPPEPGMLFMKGAAPKVEVATPDILSAMRKIEPAADKGTLVSARDLRKETGLSKEAFDKQMLALSKQDKLSLHKTDLAGKSDTEIEQLIHAPSDKAEPGNGGRTGTYYVGAAIRPAEKSYYKAAKKPEVEVSTEEKAANKASIRKGLEVEEKERTGPISVEDIRKTLERDFGTALLRGRVPPGAQGFYEWATHVGRVVGKEYQNLAVISHEIGHHFENVHGPLKDAPADVKAEIETLDYEDERKDRKEALREGFAEFFRHLLTTDIGPSLAPKTYAWFTEHYLPENEEQKVQLAKARRLIDDYRTQDPLDRASSTIYSYGQNAKALEVPQDEQLKEEIGRRLVAVGREWYDHVFLAKRLATEAEAQRPGGLGQKTSFRHVVESNYRADTAQAEEAMDGDGVYTLGEERRKLYKPLREVLAPLDKGDVELWEKYVRAQAAAEARDKKAGYNPGITEDEGDATIAEVEKQGKTDKFDKVVKDYRGYHAALVDLEVDAGLKSPEEGQRIKDSRDIYSPIYRQVDTGLRHRIITKFHDTTGGIFNTKSQIRRLGQGSNDPVMAAIDATIVRTLATYNAVNHQEMKKSFMGAMIPSFGGARGKGKWVVEVGPKLVKDSVRLEKIVDSLSEKHEVNGVEREPLLEKFEVERLKKVQQLRDGRITGPLLKWFKKHYGSEDPDVLKEATQGVWSLKEAVAFWKQDFGSNPNEHIDQFYHNGELHLVQYVDGDLYKEVMSLNSRFEASTVGKALSNVLSTWDKYITSPMKIGAVGLSTTFAPVNLVRDYGAFLAQSKETGIDRIWKPFQGVWKYGAYYLAGQKNPYAEIFDAMGGRVSPRLGNRETRVPSLRSQILAKGQKGVWGARLQWGSLRNTAQDILSIGESGVRLAEFEASIKNGGYHFDSKEQSWVHTESGKVVDILPRSVVARASSAANEVTTNFRRKGTHASVVDRVVPFFSANIAGTVRGLTGAQELLKGPGVHKRQLGMAMMLGFGAIAWALGHDEDWYKDLDPEMKNRYWIFGLPGGTPWLRVAKPYTYSALINGIEGILDWTFDGRSDRLPDVMVSELKSQVPPYRVSGLSTLLDLQMNEDRFGRKIEPQSMVEEGRHKQYRTKPYTTETAKFVGQFLSSRQYGLSPIQIDYIADQWTGGSYGTIVGTGENIGRGEVRPESAPLVKGFLMRSDHQQTVHNFYQQFSELTGAVATDKYLNPDKPDAVKIAQLQQWTRYKGVLAAIWKADKDATIDERRDMERYAIGLADYALGNPERARYPNPLRKDEKVPAAIEEARADYVGKLMQALTASPQRKPAEQFVKFRDRFMQASIERKWAASELRRLGYKPMDVTMAASKRAMKQGHRVSAESVQEVFQAMAAKP